MNKQFGDKGLVIQYLQTMLKENYNTNVLVNSEYYKTFDMNYGLAHFIAKYLDYTYPLLDKEAIYDYSHIPLNELAPYDTQPRNLSEPISIMNYFLCNNKGEKLYYNPGYIYRQTSSNQYVKSEKMKSPIYDDIYNHYMRVELEGLFQEDYHWKVETYYINNFDLPLFNYLENGNYSVKNNSIFNLEKWDTDKEICEIDDFVASYLLGRVIGPNSSMEDIYYAQKLLIQDREIEEDEKGVWCASGNEGTYKDMTQTVINYQKQRVIPNSSNTLFVTGYFDVRTESQILKDIGDVSYGILGL